MTRISQFRDLQLTPEQRRDVARTLAQAPRADRQHAAKLCSTIIRHDGDTRASAEEMAGIKVVGELLATTKQFGVAFPPATWAALAKQWTDKQLAKDLYKLNGVACSYSGDRTTEQAAAIKQLADTLMAYDGDPLEIAFPVRALREMLQGLAIGVPQTGTREGATVVLRDAVDADAMEADLRRLLTQAIPKILPQEPTLELRVHRGPIGKEGYLAIVSPNRDEPVFVAAADCRGSERRTFWIQPESA